MTGSELVFISLDLELDIRLHLGLRLGRVRATAWVRCSALFNVRDKVMDRVRVA